MVSAPDKGCDEALVWELSRWRDERAHEHGGTPPIPEKTIPSPPSAEPRPGQLDSDTLPDYGCSTSCSTTISSIDLGATGGMAAGSTGTWWKPL